jgi:protein-disulfide isomerase
MNNQNNNTLAIAITFAAVLIAGALVFFAMQMRNSSGIESATEVDLSQQIEEGIQEYVQKQEEEARQAQIEANKPKLVEGDFTDDDAVLGDKDAPVTMIEFSDYECPFCKRHATQTLPELTEKYIDTGKLKLVFRDFPLGFHDPLATEQAMAAECVREQTDDETYFAYHDLIFETTNSNGKGMQKDQLYELADQIGVNKAEFTECLDSEKYKDEVAKDLADGQSAGVSGTPGFLINGQLVSGAQPFSVFEQIIEAELNK